jgi:hypothetical protein
MIGTQIEEVLIRGGVIDENGAGAGLAFGRVKKIAVMEESAAGGASRLCWCN